MPLIRQIIYPTLSYSELKVKMELMGYHCISEDLYRVFAWDDWKWEVFCVAMEERATPDMDTSELDRIVEEMLDIG